MRFHKTVAKKIAFAGFPLILTFSHWEKEQPMNAIVKRVSLRAICSREFAKGLGAFPPLPAGEGYGLIKKWLRN